MRTHLTLQNLALLSLGLLAFCLPFEMILFSLGPLQVSNLEMLLAFVLLFAVALAMARRPWHEEGRSRFPRTWLALWAILALALFLSTVLAPEHQMNAAKGSARLLAGMVLAFCVPLIFRKRDDMVVVVVPLLVGGLLAALIGLLEISNAAAFEALEPFRVVPTTAGPFMRLTSGFDHANQAAMFLEATAPLLVAALLVTHRQRARIVTAIAEMLNRRHPAEPDAPGSSSAADGQNRFAFVAFSLLPVAPVLFWLQAIIATYSRAAIIALLVSCMALFMLAPRRKLALPWLGLGLGLGGLLIINALLNPVVRMRLQTEGDNEWYAMHFEAPETLTVDAGQAIATEITVHNEGILTWSSDPPVIIQAGGHWVMPESGTSLAYRPRWPLAQTVRPGESLSMQVALLAPLRDGSYEFHWDIVQEHVTWFSTKTGERSTTQVTVRPATAGAARPAPEIEQALNRVVPAPRVPAPIPGRRTLWRVAAQVFSDRPLVGIGMDNFRLVHGRALGYEEWNDTIHTNNWYIEMLVSLGFLGALPFFAWMGLVGVDAAGAVRRNEPDVWRIALAGALFAYFLHGALDYFLGSNSTGLLFWLLCGLWVATGPNRQSLADEGNDAYRL